MEFTLEELHIDSSIIHLLHYGNFNPEMELDKLTEDELNRYHSFHHTKRKREFVATRILRHQLFGFEHIHYDSNGAPYINQEGYISVSHCNCTVGLALNPDYQIGLDLETPREQIHLLAHKFLSEHERQTFSIEDNIELTKIWSAKEALYKLAGRKEIVFARDLLLESKEIDYWSGRIKNVDHDRKVKLHIFEHQGTIISINKEAIEIV